MPDRLLGRRARRWAFGGALALVYLYSFPYFAQIHNANELPRIQLTRAIVDEGRFYIDDFYRAEPTVDVAGPVFVDERGQARLGDPRGHVYANKAPGQSFLGVPFYFAAKAWAWLDGRRQPTAREITFALRLGTSTLPTLAFLPLLAALLAALFPGEDTARARRLALAAYALGTMALEYSILLFSHQLSAVAVASAYALVALRARGLRGDGAVASAGFLAAASVVCDYQAVFAALPVFAYALVTLRPRRRVAGLFAAGGLVPSALLLVYHAACFGRPWRTGYSYTMAFMHFHEQGFLGLRGPRWEAFVGSTVVPDNGLLFFSPFLVLVIPGIVLMLRRRARGAACDLRADGVLALYIVLFFLYFVSGIAMWRGGWEIGPRYITVALPFVVAPLAAALIECERREPLRALACGLCLAGMAIYVACCATFPLYQDDAGYRNPLFEVTFRLLREGYAPYNLGRLFGLHGGASEVPLWLAAGGLLVALATDVAGNLRRRCASGAGALAVAGLVLLGYSFIPPAGTGRALRSYEYVTRIWEPRP